MSFQLFKNTTITSGNTLQVNSSGDDKYIKLSHNNTDGYVSIGTGDLVISCPSQKTMKLDTVVWNDLRTPVTAIKLGSTNPPSWVAFQSSEVLSFSDQAIEGDEELVAFAVQLPHNYKEGTNITPHIHWAAADTSAGNVIWKFSYSWANQDVNFPNPTITTCVAANIATANCHIYTALTTMNGVGKTLSSMVLCSLRRNSSDANDTYNSQNAYLLEVDFHYQLDTLGSRQELVK